MVLENNPAFKELIKFEGMIKAILENPKAYQNTLFRRYVIFQLPSVYF